MLKNLNKRYKDKNKKNKKNKKVNDINNIEEVGGPKGPEPTRYGDWEVKGRVSDF